MPWDKKVPFAFEDRNPADAPIKDMCWFLLDYIGYGRTPTEWREARQYKAQLILTGYCRGRSSVRMDVRVIPQLTEDFQPFRTRITLSQFMLALKSAPKVWRNGETGEINIYGTWVPNKVGKNYGLELVLDE